MKTEYMGLDFKTHLKKVLEEKRLLYGITKASFNRIRTQEEKAAEYTAGSYFTKKYGIVLTVGDITALENNFEAHANKLLQQIKR